MSYLPIEDHALIGNMHTASLVGLDGRIDWLCLPQFDSPSVFASILDDKKGGHFSIRPTGGEHYTHKQMYYPDTAIVITRFLGENGIGEVWDFMPTDIEQAWLIRIVKVLHGEITFKVELQPAFNYGRDSYEAQTDDEKIIFTSPTQKLGLTTPISLEADGTTYQGEFTLRPDEQQVFSLFEPDMHEPIAPGPVQADHILKDTITYWQRWISQCRYEGRWKEEILRSAITLKLLTYEPTGAIVAAPTCSLPEELGGERNWDYRYTWLRDAAFTVYAFIKLGFYHEAENFISWLISRCFKPDGKNDLVLQPLYGIDGRTVIEEETLDHFEGYRQSGPVRIGNAAYNQVQMDVYGELLDSIYLFNKYGSFISYDVWLRVRNLLDWLVDNWKKQDHGIWEVRTEPSAFVYSRVMSWVAFDRGLRIGQKRSYPHDRIKWENTRNEIYEEIMAHGWNEEIGSFVQRYDDTALDASNLILPLVFFVPADDPSMQSTIAAIQRDINEGGLSVGSQVYRYNLDESSDGLSGKEGTFNMCSFWLVEALTRAGNTPEARLLFERMLGSANHVGLYAEQNSQTDFALGNFPQAFTHLSFISAAINLNKALEK